MDAASEATSRRRAGDAMTGPIPVVRTSGIRRYCSGCKDWKLIDGGTCRPGGKGFKCATCKPRKAA